MTSAPLIAFRNVDLAFGDHLVLGKLSFEIGHGEIVCVVGPSGCGKTTALRVAAGLIAADARRGRFRRRADESAAPRRGDRVPGLSQGAAALAHCGRQRLARAGGDADATRERRRERIDALLKRVGLLAIARQISVADVGRHAAATADRPLSGAGAGRADDGRAVRRARRDDAPEPCRTRCSRSRARAAPRYSSSPTISRRRSISATA